MGNKQGILERLVTLGDGIEQNLDLLHSLLQKREKPDLELRLVREIQQDFVLRRALLRKLQERVQQLAAPDLIDKVLDRLEE